MVSIVICSKEWETLIYDYDNIKSISDIRYYLCDENSLMKQIQFKFDIKLKSTDEWITLNYKFVITDTKFLELEYIDKVCNSILVNHNLED